LKKGDSKFTSVRKGHQTELDKELLIEMYRLMVKIRLFEEAAMDLYQRDILYGSCHLYIGEEAMAVGVGLNLKEDDYSSSNHRGHGHCLAKGGDEKKLMAELLGRIDGYCKGRGGSMHYTDLSKGMLPASGIVGGHIGIATGAALSAQMRGTDQVVACYLGEGASNQGIFYECLNLAALWKAPIIYVCENNLYAQWTSAKKTMALPDVALKGSPFGIPGVVVDGNDVTDVYEKAKEAFERAREGKGPTLIEGKTYRWKGHFAGDVGIAYRPKEEIESWIARCPIKMLRERMLSQGLSSEDELSAIDRVMKQEIEEAVAFAQASPFPRPEQALEYVYLEGKDVS
jgi:pyruvate dehydrogenase E1 component alpha subunit